MRPEDVPIDLVAHVWALLDIRGVETEADDVQYVLAAIIPDIQAATAAEISALGAADYRVVTTDPALLQQRTYIEGFLDGYDRAGLVVEQYIARLAEGENL